eukprot:10939479-Heterocapsa_arctica.AAC.1
MDIVNEPEIALIQDIGPPWYDDLTGEPLDTEKVKEAMQKERDSLNEFHTYERVPEEQVDDIWNDRGATIVRSRWVRIKKPDGHQLRREDGHLRATASGVGARLLLALAGHRRCRGEAWILQIGDVSTAFLHAPLPPDRRFYVVPPATENEGGALWHILKALYGLRESPRFFQEHLAKVASGHGWQRLLADPQLFYHAAS